MLPLLLAATFALPAVGVAVVAHLRQWRKTCAPAPDEVEATQPAEAAPTEDQAEPQEAAGQAEATPPNDQAPKDDQAEQRDAGAQPSRHRPASAVGCGLHIPPPQQIWTNHLGQDLPCGARTFQIFVKDGRGTKTLDVTSDFTASDIKAGVSPKAGYSLLDEPTYIKRCGTVMTDAMTLGQLGVGKGDQVHVLTQLAGGMPTSEELTNAFMKFDHDGDGYLSPAELKAILCRPTPDGKELTEERIDEIVRRYDANNDGVLSVEELAEAWQDLKLSQATTSSADTQCTTAAGKALAALVHAYGIAPGTPEAQAREISERGLWPETWDGGMTWHEGGNKDKALPAALVAAERAALAAVEAQNVALLGTNEPDSDAAAEYSHGCGVTIGFVVEFTETHDCWNWPTWKVMRDIVKPLTAAR